MRIEKVEIENFRAISKMELIFNNQTTAIMGNNGVGKTSILDALAILLSQASARIVSQPSRARDIPADDVRINENSCKLSIGADIDTGGIVRWSLVKNRKANKAPGVRSSELEELNKNTKLFQARIDFNDGGNVTLPLAVYYDVHRAVLDVPLRVRGKNPHGYHEAYNDALSKRGTDFKHFFSWFRQREDDENEKIRDIPSYRDRDLSAVRRAIEIFTDFKKLRIRRKPLLRMTVEKDGQEFNILQLSDGEKCMLALVGDLARRLSLLNPVASAPLHGNAVVLIDELDLHLHPRWQRTIVRDLEKTFPNCQFIISTHSPQILGELSSESIYVISRGKNCGHPERSFGLDTTEVIEEIMDAPARNVSVSRILQRINLQMEAGNFARAKEWIRVLEESRRAEGLPEITRARAEMKSIELENKFQND